jgi:hypothetical protein
MSAIDLLFLLSCHFVADFVLQTDEQARGKSTDWGCLTEYVSIYSIVMSAGFAGTLLAQSALP